jgi:hypothetical protein
MSSGFRYILVVLVAATALFAGLSLWPSVRDALNGSPSQAAPASQPAPSPPSSPAAPTRATVGSSHRVRVPLTLLSERDERPADDRQWLYAQIPVTLRIKPGGRGHPAPSLTHAPLVILQGTRLWPVQQEGEWVMVRSPGGLLGYVLDSEVGTRIPYCKRKY